MDFKVELSNIDYSDERLIRALSNISEDTKYKIVMSIDEIAEIIEHYIFEKLEIDLSVSDMYLKLDEARLYYDNIFEATMITNLLLSHFGNSAVYPGGSGELQDYYNINTMIFIRKIAKFALIESYEGGYILYFDQVDEFTQTWIYKYMKEKKED